MVSVVYIYESLTQATDIALIQAVTRMARKEQQNKEQCFLPSFLWRERIAALHTTIATVGEATKE
jgi:hypothetical protein